MQNTKFFELIPTNTNINFIGKFPAFVTISVITLIALLIGINTKGFNYGIDFTGGTVVQVKFAKPIESDKVRDLMAELGAKEASVVSSGEKDKEYLITSRAVVDEKGSTPLSKKLIEKMGADGVTIQKADVVGPKVGNQLKSSAMISLFLSILLIMIYIWLRFDARFAPGATVAMIHDIVMAAGFYFLTGMEFTITSIAALLTIAGYSVNDTVVIYDRVREMYKTGNTEALAATINKALNLTLSRTILTGVVTLISVVPIAILCEGELRSFALAMCVGIFVGMYSTIYIASPFTIYIDKFFKWREAKRKGIVPRRATT